MPLSEAGRMDCPSFMRASRRETKAASRLTTVSVAEAVIASTRPTNGVTDSSSPRSASVCAQIAVQESYEDDETCLMAAIASIVVGRASVPVAAAATTRSGLFASARLLQIVTIGIAIASRRIAIAPVLGAAVIGPFGANPIGLSQRRIEARPNPMACAIVGLAVSSGPRQVVRLDATLAPVAAATCPSVAVENAISRVPALHALPGLHVSVSSPIAATMLDAFVLRPVVGIAG